ncbi:unnamed protein product [Linum tenue]|uniref:Autophagy-related protein 2 n=1 Tax=Linum tenue TaxID=586396 RepID=A0AAV0RH66_9ROSI|nr:unnamed protein product [Linum tenue]
MSPWNIPQWARKKLLQFMLKKKLGQLILGDIDLHQLELGQGAIQLKDLALNVDYLNEQWGAQSSVIIKEGSIGSLSVKLCRKDNGFEIEIEVDELELVLGQCLENESSTYGDKCRAAQDKMSLMHGEPGKLGNDFDPVAKSGSADIHEGVKTIAKMVTWLLTSFHVQIKNLLVAFEPYKEKYDKEVGCRKILVLRVAEVEFGRGDSEDGSSTSNGTTDDFLGISQLAYFLKFQGAVLELLEMGDANSESEPLSASVFGEVLSSDFTSNQTIPIMLGNEDGFSGQLKLSIPWNNGSPDLRKVDADVRIDPVELRLKPGTLKWFLHAWESFKILNKDCVPNTQFKSTDSVYFNSASHFYSSTRSSSFIPAEKLLSASGSSSLGQQSFSDSVLPGSHLIPDWMPKSVTDGVQDLDLGASVDQFFECFDGLRNSQSALGSSGMWGWTCSVFGALTAASSLASGSFLVTSEKQHIQTNLRVCWTGISISLFFQDEDEQYCCESNSDRSDSASDVHHVTAECKDISFVVQVSPQEMRIDGTVRCIEVVEISDNGKDGRHVAGSSNDGHDQTLRIQKLQATLHGALPHIGPPENAANSDDWNTLDGSDIPPGKTKIKLLSTSGITHCQYVVNSDPSSRDAKMPAAFSLTLPHFTFWVNLISIKMLMDLAKDVGSVANTSHQNDGLKSAHEKRGSSVHESRRTVGASSSAQNWQGNISITSARIILCFPLEVDKGIQSRCSWDQFIAIDLSSPSVTDEWKDQGHGRVADSNSWKRYISRPAWSVHVSVGDLGIYLVNQNDSVIIPRKKFFVQKVLSLSNRAGCLSKISLLCQDSVLTGPWVTERAKSMATSEESRMRENSVARGHEFATVTAVKDMEDMNSRTRRDMILTSAVFLHVHLPPCIVDLDSSQYHTLVHLIGQMVNTLSQGACEAINLDEKPSVSQTAVLVECDSLEVSIRLDAREETASSLQSELPGSWLYFKLKIRKVEFMSVSNIGGIKDANLLWVTHREGKLWGSVTKVPGKLFVLISCSNSSRKRGDGSGSNALSSRWAGSDIVHLCDPGDLHSITSITIRCATIVAVGGRLDWLDAIISFFTLPSPEVVKADHENQQKALHASHRVSFLLKLVDVGLSYEPYLKSSLSVVHSSISSSSNAKEDTVGPYFGCLLAASSLTISSTALEDSVDKDYKIRAQDLGFLLSKALQNPGAIYSVDYLREMGYVKVSQEALVEAILRTNCENGLQWELECSKLHIWMNTCHDTTSGLTRLASQLQQLFAPDLEELVVHLQARWNNFCVDQEKNKFNEEGRAETQDSTLPTSEVLTPSAFTKNEALAVGLMDEICEDAFCLDGEQDCQHGSSGSNCQLPPGESFIAQRYGAGAEANDTCLEGASGDCSVSLVGADSTEGSFLVNGSLPEFIESYCISDLRPLSGLSIGCQSSSEHFGDRDLARGNSGWYGEVPLSIVEDHISDVSGSGSLNQSLDDRFPGSASSMSDESVKAIGRLLLKDINVSWKMYAGTDWGAYSMNDDPSKRNCGRDTTTCLEVSLCGMELQYDLFPLRGLCASKMSLSIQDFYLYDKSKNAPWRLMLGYYYSKDHPRTSSAKAFRLDLEAVRPDPLIPLEEYRLQISLLPIRVHLHQSQLDFLISYFGPKGLSADLSSDSQQNSGSVESLPISGADLAGHSIAPEAFLPYFQASTIKLIRYFSGSWISIFYFICSFVQKFDMCPILLRVDYTPSRVDLAALGGGKYVELVNLVPWKGVELELKHVHAFGVYGWGNICETILGEWLEDISQNQVRKILRGLPTIRSLVAVGSGAAKLVSLPVESYKKDQRVVKGMQRGTVAFLRSISLEAVGLGVHLAAGAHDILLQAEYILTAVPSRQVSSSSSTAQGKKKSNVRSNQPKDAQEGMQQAYSNLSDGLGKSASALVRTPLKKYQYGASAGSALATAVRGIPAAAIAPVSACASAAHSALLGLRNSLDPEHKKESMEKYLGPTQTHNRD